MWQASQVYLVMLMPINESKNKLKTIRTDNLLIRPNICNYLDIAKVRLFDAICSIFNIWLTKKRFSIMNKMGQQIIVLNGNINIFKNLCILFQLKY